MGNMETVTDFIILGSTITGESGCSHEIKILAPSKESHDKLGVLKSRDITLPTKVHLVKAVFFCFVLFCFVFPIVMYGCELDHKEGWVLKNWCFETVVLEKTLRSPLDARRTNQSIWKEINPEYSSEGLKLKLQYFGHLMWWVDSLGKTLMQGKIEGKRRGQQKMRCLASITMSMTQGTWVWAHSGR